MNRRDTPFSGEVPRLLDVDPLDSLGMLEFLSATGSLPVRLTHIGHVGGGGTFMTNASEASVQALWRHPVKSMRGELVSQAEFTKGGLVGDRAYALIDVETGKVVSAKSVRLFPALLECEAAFESPPMLASQPPAARITLPNGVVTTSESPDVDHVLSEFFGRSVTLAQSAPEDFTIDMYHPNIADVDPEGRLDTVVEQKLGSAFFAERGIASPLPIGSFLDLFPVSVLTTSTLEWLTELSPQSHFDNRRFRMNVIVESEHEGFVENAWVGHQIALGDTVRLRVTSPDTRCVMTTLAQGDLPRDNNILRTLVQHNKIDLGPSAAYPCAGVYAVVESPGTVRRGDSVAIN